MIVWLWLWLRLLLPALERVRQTVLLAQILGRSIWLSPGYYPYPIYHDWLVVF
jgi:hypothetical protein